MQPMLFELELVFFICSLFGLILFAAWAKTIALGFVLFLLYELGTAWVPGVGGPALGSLLVMFRAGWLSPAQRLPQRLIAHF